ncbi:hypothetical protein BDN70DRAFT_878332 [Pholiota conissans]|uniref:Uncharacterized protein n=1 Tax=Pholiota conissans TaxID=109636 RepID=A0A9P6CTV2_9AGAR|nr:hypothetical protein BDN70DRAFT_878332 [Pholiota conissans]
MDVDPLADTVPPRYNVESDDEEDEVRPLSVAPAAAMLQIDISIKGDIPTGKGLLVATGDVARRWARGADLGEQSAVVYVNKVQIGLVFQPKWTESSVLVSEALGRLPLSAMHPYAKTVLHSFKPKSLALLDSYPVPTYATDAPIPFHEAPVRYLSTAQDTAFLTSSAARLFAPPNLIQSTSAAFLSLASLPPPTPSPSTPSSPLQATLILIPAPHIPPPAPKDITASLSLLSQDHHDDDGVGAAVPKLVGDAQRLVFEALGERGAAARVWQVGAAGKEREGVAKRRTEVGEGGMYI